MAQNTLEMSQQIREAAEKNFKQAQASYGEYMEAMTGSLGAWSTNIGMWSKGTPENEMTTEFKVVQDQAISFAKQNAEACFAMATELAKAKDIREMMSLQSQFAQSQMQSYAKQAGELGRLMLDGVHRMQPMA
jgi:hypothetical protein